MILSIALRARQWPVLMGQSATTLVGQVGVARGDLAPRGPVPLASEAWTARPADRTASIKKGDKVEVVSVDGLELRVRKKE